jgi:hypothetical protein
MQDRTQKKIFIQKQNTTHLQNKRIIEQFKKSKSGFGGILFAVIEVHLQKAWIILVMIFNRHYCCWVCHFLNPMMNKSID